jgi:hypothetical protein
MSKSALGEASRFISIVVVPARTRLFEKVSIPMDSPGETIAVQGNISTTPPLPLRVWAAPSLKPPETAETSRTAPL